MAVTTLGERASSANGEGCHEGSFAMLAAHHMSGVSGRCNPWQREGGRAEGAWAMAKPPHAEKHVVPAPGVVPVQGVVLVLGVAPSQSAAVLLCAFRHPALNPEITCPRCTGSGSLTKRMPWMWLGII